MPANRPIAPDACDAMSSTDFKIRGNYPNQRTLLRSMDDRLSVEKKGVHRPLGYLPPVAEYRTAAQRDSDHPHEITVRDIDLPLLYQSDLEKAGKHFSYILKARDGDGEARQKLDLARQSHYHDLRDRLGGHDLIDDRFVVTSNTSETYKETHISHKGSVLLKLSQLGYPVPDFVILAADVFLQEPKHREKLLGQALENLERLTCQKLGHGPDPLVFAIRCAMPYYVPGVMPTYLNVGITENSVVDIEKIFGRQPAAKMFLNNLKNLLMLLDRELYEAMDDTPGPLSEPDRSIELVGRISKSVAKIDRKLLEDPFHQAAFFMQQAYKHYEDNLDLLVTFSRGEKRYPSLILQKMICTVRDDESYAGVLSSRHSKTGVGIQLETARNIFGEEIMTGTVEPEQTTFEDRKQIKDTFPAVYHFAHQLTDLEREFESPVTIEFAVEAIQGHQFFALLQLNETQMTGRAAFMSVTDLHMAGTITKKRVTELICPYHVKQIESDSIDDDSLKTLYLFSSGVSILPRAAVCARIFFTAEAAMQAKKRGDKICFCKKNFVPGDTVVMREVDAIVSLTSAAIHVVTICQSFGIPALLNLEAQGVRLESDGRLVNSSGKQIKEGDWITISSRMKSLFWGKANFRAARLMRYMKREKVDLDEHEKKIFADMAYAYRYYRKILKGLQLGHVSTLNELIRLVNIDLRQETEKADKFVCGWFDSHESLYVEGVLKSDMGDHLNQQTVFDMLTLERKIRFFKSALAKCNREQIFGYAAGAFMLGRFISVPQQVAFWKVFSPDEIGLLVNEWILFEKYMLLLHDVGERKIVRAKKKILKDGLSDLALHAGKVKSLIPLKLSRPSLDAVRDLLPKWRDPQTLQLLDILARPYHAFYDFGAEWSLGQLKRICEEESLPLPGPDDK